MKNFWLDRIDKKKGVSGVSSKELDKIATSYAITGDKENELDALLCKLANEIIKHAQPSLTGLIALITIDELRIACKKRIKSRGLPFGGASGNKFWNVKAFNFCTTIMLGRLKELFRSAKSVPITNSRKMYKP